MRRPQIRQGCARARSSLASSTPSAVRSVLLTPREERLRLEADLDRLRLRVVRVLQQLAEDGELARVAREHLVDQRALVDLDRLVVACLPLRLIERGQGQLSGHMQGRKAGGVLVCPSTRPCLSLQGCSFLVSFFTSGYVQDPGLGGRILPKA